MSGKRKFSTTRILAGGFLLAIAAGTVLLSLPFASAGGIRAPLPDVLFTAVSAVCVTGLVTVPTYAQWSLFGQLVILVLNAVCADARDPDILKQLGVSEFHGAVVSADHLEDSVLISMLLKEAGVPFVLVKAATELEGRVLRKVGADKVIIPDLEMGIRVANQIAEGGYSTASKETSEEPGPQPGYLGPE